MLYPVCPYIGAEIISLSWKWVILLLTIAYEIAYDSCNSAHFANITVSYFISQEYRTNKLGSTAQMGVKLRVDWLSFAFVVSRFFWPIWNYVQRSKLKVVR